MAFGLRRPDRETLAKIPQNGVNYLKYAKNFIVEHRLVPHFMLVFLGLLVALCNVLVARGAEQLYTLIPADPQSQVAIASSVDRFTPLISNDSISVEKYLTLPAGSENNGFATDVKTTETIKTGRPEENVANIATETGPRTKNLMYTVQAGDTLSGLAMKFNVLSSSIKFANNITNADLIQPGTTLKIPPEGWVPSAKDIAAKNKTAAKTASAKSSGGITVRGGAGSKYNGYPYGYCTYYVATRRAIPASWGNAGQWLSSARSAGYATGSMPVPGAVMVSRESWWGHVAYVESISGDSFTISEMNYAGWGVVSRRTLPISDSVVKGFVY